MKVVVIFGSPHKNGTTELLADQFVNGARDAGHDVFFFRAAEETVHPCVACGYCAAHNGACAFHDCMDILNQKLLEADLVAFCSPLHYFSFSAQIKIVLSRFHANNARLKARQRKAVLLAASSIREEWAMDGLRVVYHSILRYLGWIDAGQVLAVGCPDQAAARKTGFPQQAYALGRNLVVAE